MSKHESLLQGYYDAVLAQLEWVKKAQAADDGNITRFRAETLAVLLAQEPAVKSLVDQMARQEEPG